MKLSNKLEYFESYCFYLYSCLYYYIPIAQV